MSTERKKAGRPNPAYQVCIHCGVQRARLVRLPQVYSRGEQMVVIENVPMMLCDSCGQSYISSEVWGAIDRVLACPDRYARQKTVKVAELA